MNVSLSGVFSAGLTSSMARTTEGGGGGIYMTDIVTVATGSTQNVYVRATQTNDTGRSGKTITGVIDAVKII